MTTTRTKRSTRVVHRYQATGGGVPVNGYLVEGASGLVAVDATLTVSDGKALRALADRLGKPLLGVVVTHPHPDHYGGIAELVRDLEVPRFATAGVIEVARRDDAIKEEILRPMFGDEWAAQRAFPDAVVADGESVELEDISLRVRTAAGGDTGAIGGAIEVRSAALERRAQVHAGAREGATAACDHRRPDLVLGGR